MVRELQPSRAPFRSFGDGCTSLCTFSYSLVWVAFWQLFGCLSRHTASTQQSVDAIRRSSDAIKRCSDGLSQCNGSTKAPEGVGQGSARLVGRAGIPPLREGLQGPPHADSPLSLRRLTSTITNMQEATCERDAVVWSFALVDAASLLGCRRDREVHAARGGVFDEQTLLVPKSG